MKPITKIDHTIINFNHSQLRSKKEQYRRFTQFMINQTIFMITSNCALLVFMKLSFDKPQNQARFSYSRFSQQNQLKLTHFSGTRHSSWPSRSSATRTLTTKSSTHTCKSKNNCNSQLLYKNHGTAICEKTSFIKFVTAVHSSHLKGQGP